MSDTDREGTAESGPPKLGGHMGVIEVAFTVLAFSAPLTVAMGYIVFIVLFGGVAAPISFLIAMVLLLLFSVGYVTMARGIPNPGAFYAFIAHGLHKAAGLGAAFIATIAYLAIIAGISAFFGITTNAILIDMGGPDIAWYWLAVPLLVLVGIIGYVGIELSAKVLAILLAIEVVIVTIFDVSALIDGGPGGYSPQSFSLSTFAEGNMALGVLFAISMFIGFEATAIFREEARDPDRTIPRATYLSVAFIGVFYAFTVWCLIVAVGPDNAVGLATSQPGQVFPDALTGLLGVVAKDIALAFLLGSVFASTLATHNIFARYLFNLGTDRALPSYLGRVHPKQRSPYLASVTASAVSFLTLIVVVVGGADPNLFYGRAAGFGALCLIILMLLTSIAVLVHFGRAPADSSLSTWSTRIAPGLATLGLAVVVVLVAANANTFLGTTTGLSIAFFVGVGAFFIAGVAIGLRLKAKRPDVYDHLGRDTTPAEVTR